jgi:hypothetical protein
MGSGTVTPETTSSGESTLLLADVRRATLIGVASLESE